MQVHSSAVDTSPSVPDNHPCPVCGGTLRKPLFVARDPHDGIKGEWTIARCTGCDLVQLDPMLTNEELSELYPSEYYSFQSNAEAPHRMLDRLKSYLYKWQEVVDPKFDRPGRVLDSGCGSGWALSSFNEAGWECYGVDPSASAIEVGRKQYGLELSVGTVSSVTYPDNHFDYVRANHSLEHDPNCADTLKEFRRVIKPDGKLLIGVPNIDSIPAKLYGRYWWSLCPPVHTYSFSRRHLTRMLETAGFEVERVRYCGNWGGVLGSLQIRLNASDPALTAKDGVLVNSMPLKALAQGVAVMLNLVGQGDWIEVVARPK